MFITIILVALILNGFQLAQSHARDAVTENDINNIYQKLEEYYNETTAYPSTITDQTLPGLDPEALTDINGTFIAMGDTSKKDVFGAEAQNPPTENESYQYLPYNCLANTCRGYILRGYLENLDENMSNITTRYSLNSF